MTINPLLNYDVLSAVVPYLSDVRNLEGTSKEVSAALKKYPKIVPEIYRRSLALLHKKFPDLYNLIPGPPLNITAKLLGFSDYPASLFEQCPDFNPFQMQFDKMVYGIRCFYTHLQDTQRTQITFEEHGREIIPPRELGHDVGDDIRGFISDETSLRELMAFNRSWPEVASNTLDTIKTFCILTACLQVITYMPEVSSFEESDRSMIINWMSGLFQNLSELSFELGVATIFYPIMHTAWNYPKIGLRALKLTYKRNSKYNLKPIRTALSNTYEKINGWAGRTLSHIAGYCPLRFC